MTVSITRPKVRNAVDPETASALKAAFERFDTTDSLAVAVLTGAGGNFCAGYDLKGLAAGASSRLPETDDGPMGPTRMALGKPVIAAIEGYAVAGGLELALWCDLRVAANNATLGVFNRRFGVPLIDMGTIRLPRMIGQGRALDLILTGRAGLGDGGAADQPCRPACRTGHRARGGRAAGAPARRAAAGRTPSRPAQRSDPVVPRPRGGGAG